MRTRVAQELQSSGLHIFVTTKQLSCTSHVSSFAAPDTDHKHKFSLLSFRQSHQHPQDLRYTTTVYPAMIHGRVADQHKSHLSQVMSPKSSRSSLKTSSPDELSLTGILGQIRIKYRKDLRELSTNILSPKIWRNFEKLVPR